MATTPTESGSHAAGPPQKKSLAWLWILLALLVLGLIAWLLLRDDDDADLDAAPVVVAEETEEIEEPLVDETEETEAPTDEETEEPTDVETSDPEETTEATELAPGVVLVNGVDLMTSNVVPATVIGEPVEAEAVTVQAVVADEAFLVGPDPETTILVRFPSYAGEGEPESPVSIEEGQLVSFTGTIAEVDDELLTGLRLVDEDLIAGRLGTIYVQVDELL